MTSPVANPGSTAEKTVSSISATRPAGATATTIGEMAGGIQTDSLPEPSVNSDATPGAKTKAKLVVLISGSGTNLQALIDACEDPEYGCEVVAVGADRSGIKGLERAMAAGIPTFVEKVSDYDSRAEWDTAMTDAVEKYDPDLVVSAGFLKLLGPEFLETFEGRVVNTHNSLLPSFAGIRGPEDALAYGVKFTGATLFFVDPGVDTGRVIAQCVVPVEAHDTVAELLERIQIEERKQLVTTVGRMMRDGWTSTGRWVEVG